MTKRHHHRFLISASLLTLNLLLSSLSAHADDAPVKTLKPLFYQGTVDTVNDKGIVLTNTHNQQYFYYVQPDTPLYGPGESKITLADFHPADRVKVLFRPENPANAVAVYKMQVLTKAEKTEYARKEMERGN